MSATIDQRLECLQNLPTETCLGCVSNKRAKQSFCPACFASLPTRLKKALYNPEGYVETFYEALEVVKQRTYGFEVLIEVQTRDGSKEITFRKKGTEAAARRAAVLKTCFVRVVGLTPYTCERWVRAFGYGRM